MKIKIGQQALYYDVPYQRIDTVKVVEFDADGGVVTVEYPNGMVTGVPLRLLYAYTPEVEGWLKEEMAAYIVARGFNKLVQPFHLEA